MAAVLTVGTGSVASAQTPALPLRRPPAIVLTERDGSGKLGLLGLAGLLGFLGFRRRKAEHVETVRPASRPGEPTASSGN